MSTITVTPRMIVEYLDKFVEGQDEAKKTLSVALFMHYVRFFQSQHTTDTLKKSNVLLMGPSGNGKTLMVKSACAALELIGKMVFGWPKFAPMLEIDCTSLSARGWEGDNFTGLLDDHRKMIGRTNATASEAKQILASSVIYFDEFDKLCMPAVGKSGTDHNKTTQYNLLKAVEGTPLKLPGLSVPVDTSKMLFVFSGNFPQIRHKRKDNKKVMGFTGQQENKDIDIFTELQHAGMITQLAGRVSYVAELQELDRKQLRKVLVSHILPEVESTFNFMGYDMKISNYYLTKIVDEAISKGTGARGLQAAVDKHFMKQLLDMEFAVK